SVSAREKQDRNSLKLFFEFEDFDEVVLPTVHIDFKEGVFFQIVLIETDEARFSAYYVSLHHFCRTALTCSGNDNIIQSGSAKIFIVPVPLTCSDEEFTDTIFVGPDEQVFRIGECVQFL